jgi:hypothetical protein
MSGRAGMTELSPTIRPGVQVRGGKRAHAIASDSDDEDELPQDLRSTAETN